MIAQTERNAGRSGVTDRVGERLLCDPEYFVLDSGSEHPVNAPDVYIGFQMLGRTLFHETCEPHWQCGLCAGGSQGPYAPTGLRPPLPDKLPRAIDLLTCLEYLRLREQMGGEFKLDRDADEPLRQRIVNLARDAVALCKDRIELGTNCTNTHPIHRKDNSGDQECGQ